MSPLSEPNWRDRSACIDEDPEMFAVNDREGMTADKAAEIAAAKAICKRCDVKAECLADARELGSDAWGVWGGLTDLERGELPKNGPRRIGGLPNAQCGTESGYRRHTRAGLAACEKCLEANRVARRIRESRKASA